MKSCSILYRVAHEKPARRLVEHKEHVLRGVNWPEREADHLPTSDTAVGNSWRYNCIPPYILKNQVFNHVSNLLLTSTV